MGASWAMRRSRVAGAKPPALVPRTGMSTGFLARVRWRNLAIALAVLALLTLLVAWPALSPPAPVVPPATADVAPPPAPTVVATPRPGRAAVRPRPRPKPERRRVRRRGRV